MLFRSDLKPSNVVVDATGRPRVLDFGLAKLASDSRASVTDTGDFLGTPAYAAPEQWRGEELDVRADVYSLGAILFEMLTGRRVVQGEGLQVLASAVNPAAPRPSSIVHSIPRELDAITLQALATEREQRYQSLDAFAADLRHFLAGEPISAHPPGAGYLLRKLVARNRLASSLVVLLVGATFVYAALTSRQAEQLATQRDRALQAGLAEKRAHEEAEAERKLAEAARAEAEEHRARAEQESENAEKVLDFFLGDIVKGADPQRLGHEPSLVEIMRSAVGKVVPRFGDSPLVEMRVHRMLGSALMWLGSYPEAESELRAAREMQLDPRLAAHEDSDEEIKQIARVEAALGNILWQSGKYEQAESSLRSAIERYESLESPPPEELAVTLDCLAAVVSVSRRFEEALELQSRAVELASADEKHRLVAEGNLGVILNASGRREEARALWERLLPRLIELEGEHGVSVANMRTNLASADGASVEATLRKTLDDLAHIYGPDHPALATTLHNLSVVLYKRGALSEAREHAQRGLAVLNGSTGGNVESARLRNTLGLILKGQGDTVGAEQHLAEAEKTLFEVDRLEWESTLSSLVEVLRTNGKLDEADALLQRACASFRPDNRPWPLVERGDLRRARGDLDGAVEDFEEAIALLISVPDRKPELAHVLDRYARALRELGDEEGAVELELQAAELRK